MLSLEGTILSVIHRPARTAKDGKSFDEYWQVQLQVVEPLADGEVRYGLHTLSTREAGPFRPHVGNRVSVPVRAYVAAGAIRFTLAEGGSPTEVRSQFT